MRRKSVPEKEPATQVVKNIRRDAATLLGRGQDPHRTGRPARRGQYRRALPSRGDCPEPLLPLVERLSRGREEATGWRYGPGRDLGRGHANAVPRKPLRPFCNDGRKNELKSSLSIAARRSSGLAPAPTRAAIIDPADVPATSAKLTLRMASPNAPTNAAARQPPP